MKKFGAPKFEPLVKRYQLKSLHRGSECYGNCEVCDQPAAEVFALSQLRKRMLSIGKSVYEASNPRFGHEDCLLTVMGPQGQLLEIEDQTIDA